MQNNKLYIILIVQHTIACCGSSASPDHPELANCMGENFPDDAGIPDFLTSQPSFL